MAVDAPAIVIDNGSYMTRAGFAGEPEPQATFPTTLGLCSCGRGATHTHLFLNKDISWPFIGDNAVTRRGILNLRYPVQRGTVTNWEDIEDIWRHVYDKDLHAMPENQPILITEPVLSSKANREKMMETFFEKFHIPSFFVSIQGVLALYASGRITGTVVDSGLGSTQVVPVFEGIALPHAASLINIGGQQLTEYLCKLLQNQGHILDTYFSKDRETVTLLKQAMCYLASDFDQEMARDTSELHKSYKLPDGQTFTLGNQRFSVPEAMFRPSLVDIEASGIHTMTSNSINKCDSGIRRLLIGNILLCGGNTLLPGFAGRLTHEIKSLTQEPSTVKVTEKPGGESLAWKGGSLLASLPVFQKMCVTKQEFAEYGSVIVHRKCF